MSRFLHQRRAGLVIIAGFSGLALLAGCLILYRLLMRRGPLHDELVSFEKEENWQAFGGAWQYFNGIMNNPSDERGAKLMTGPTYWTNYSVEADVLLLGQYGDAGLILRSNDEEEGVDAYHGYMAGLRDLDNTLMMGRADYGWREYAAESVLPRVIAQQWYHLKFLAFECDFGVSATSPQGQTTTVSVHDPGCIQSGRFGLKSYNTGAQWRNVEIKPATQADLAAMLGNEHPQQAVPLQFPTGMEPAPYDRYLEPIERDLQAHRTDLHAVSISSLRLLSPDAPTTVTVRGVVTLTSPALFVQDSTGGLAITNSHPHAPLQIGDEIEARGNALLHDFSSELRDADIRLLWSHTPVSPVAVTPSQAATGAFDAEYVEVEGRLVERNDGTNGTQNLTLEDGSQSFMAIVHGAGRYPRLPELKEKSRLRLRGICVVGSEFTRDITAFALLLPSAGDVEVLEGPPWWNTIHVVELVICLLLFPIAALTGWFFVERWRMQAVLDERQRLAHEMHDTLAQSFAGLGFQLEAIRDEVRDGIDIVPQLEEAREMVRSSHEEARRSISALRPEHLESLGLLRALEDCARRMISGSSSVNIEARTEGSERTIPVRIADTLLRIGYEAIANAVRHAHPAWLTISLVYRRSSVEMIIVDDGRGFVVSSDSAGFGIRGMNKRADHIGARFTIDSTPGYGTVIHVVAPLPPSLLQASWRRLQFRLHWRKEHHDHGIQATRSSTHRG
jgi:two-component sensor histidine kinase